MTDFLQAVEFVLANEGGLEENVSDSGGTTNWGISFRFLKEIKPDSIVNDIIDMTKDQAIAIYLQYFWRQNHYDKILNQKVGNYIFDMVCNIGAATAIKIAQSALRSLNATNDIIVDGLLGAASLDAINHAGILLMPVLRAHRENYYRNLAAQNPNDAKFLDGWLARCMK